MSEELQRYLKKRDSRAFYEGHKLDGFKHFILGSTTLKQLKQAGIINDFVNEIVVTPKIWQGSASPNSKPDEIILDNKTVILVVERKLKKELKTSRQEELASEQCLTYMQQVGANLGVVTDYSKFLWVTDPENKSTEVRYVYDSEELFSQDYRTKNVIKNVIANLDNKTDSILHAPAVDPSSLADSVWQTIWLATHEEPKLCLATFVELFLYKFLSDLEVLPSNMRIEKLNVENKKFSDDEGITQIEYYCSKVRHVMKKLFPEKATFQASIANFKTGSDTTSIIDGFAFLEPGIANHNHPLQTFNSSFMSIVKSFIGFAKLTKIDSEFKSKVYEKFLKKNAKQKKLGQYLTPRTIVRAIITMANPNRLMRQRNSSICDPACGVGGFLLEPLLHENLLVDNFKIDGDDIKWKIELIGMEVDRQTNILAKANMLIHLAETYKELNNRQKRKFVDLMNQTFLLTDHTKVLGALEFPQKDRFDLILSNPPFTVSGTKVIKEQISESNELKDQYEQSGIGTESLFLRWIIDALKPNCQAFVIVPTGILTRTETAARGYLLKHCVLDAIISLPENTFYNTSNPTYILAFTKKERVDEHTDISEEVPEKDVFAYLVREIGETRDTLRLPCQSDLKDMTRQFRAFYSDREVFEARNINCKIIPKTNLEAKDRWDVDRFWTDKEKQELGLIGKITTMSLDEFESIIESTLTATKEEIKLIALNIDQGDSTLVSLGDKNYFRLIRGKRIRKRDIHLNPGSIPVISSSGEEEKYLGLISKKWLEDNEHPIFNSPMATINADGSVGCVFVRREPEYTFIDVVIGVELLDANLDRDYVKHSIREALAKAQFKYDAKLYTKRLSKIEIKIPIMDGKFDLARQQQEAEKYDRLEELKKTIERISNELKEKFIVTK